MRKQRIFIGITALLVVVIIGLLIRYAGDNSPRSLKDALPVTVYTLSNGLTLVVVENHRIPAISHTVFVRVGGADDPAGKSGLAHYLEHLLFKGTKTVSAEEYDRRLSALGAENNAYTTSDYTAYYVNAPLEALEQVMALESDRFANLVIDDTAALTERDVIQEERRLRVDNNPRGQLSEQMFATQFLMHPYRMPVIGWAQDIAALTPQDARKFFGKHYVPTAMVLVVAGDVEPKDVRRLAMRYYGGIERKILPARTWYSEPPAIAQRAVTIEDARVKQRQWVRQYSAPSLGITPAKEAVTLELVSAWLGSGKASLLYQELVERQKLAVTISAAYDDTQVGPGLFVIRAIPRDGVSMQTLTEAIDATLASAFDAGPDPASLARAKTLYRADITYAQDGLDTVASYIGALMMVGKTEAFFYDLPAMIDAITAEEMQDVAKRSLLKKYAVTGTLLPVALDPGAVDAIKAPGAEAPMAGLP